nr:hypothetical protein [Tanacetum cinerariifolium]
YLIEEEIDVLGIDVDLFAYESRFVQLLMNSIFSCKSIRTCSLMILKCNLAMKSFFLNGEMLNLKVFCGLLKKNMKFTLRRNIGSLKGETLIHESHDHLMIQDCLKHVTEEEKVDIFETDTDEFNHFIEIYDKELLSLFVAFISCKDSLLLKASDKLLTSFVAFIHCKDSLDLDSLVDLRTCGVMEPLSEDVSSLESSSNELPLFLKLPLFSNPILVYELPPSSE